MGNKEIFDRMAQTYDTPERVRIAAIIAQAIREQLQDTRDRSAMDLGCGTGLVGLELLDEFADMTFVDSSANMIAIVDEKIAHRGAAHARTLQLDLEAGERTDLKVDDILLVQVLLHIRDIGPFLGELHEMLKADGHLIIVDFDWQGEISSDLVHNGFKQDHLREVLAGAGFRAIRSRTFHHGQAIFMGKVASLFLMEAIK